MKAIVTIASGRSYRSRFAKYCYSNWRAYADRHGLALVVYEDLLDHSPRGTSRSVAWQKCLAIAAERSRRFEQVVWIDSDVLMNYRRAPNIFDGVEPNEIGVVEDFIFPSPEQFRARLRYLFQRWRSLGILCPESYTPQDYLIQWGLPAREKVAQTGVIVANPELHGSLFRKVYENYEDKGAPYWHYEMRPLSYEIVTNSEVKWLDPAFNVVTVYAVKDEELDLFLSAPGKFEHILRRLGIAADSIPSGKRDQLRQIHKRLFEESYFLHFAGAQGEMSYLSGVHGGEA